MYLFWGRSQAQHRKQVCEGMSRGYSDTHGTTLDVFSRSLYCTVLYTTSSTVLNFNRFEICEICKKW